MAPPGVIQLKLFYMTGAVVTAALPSRAGMKEIALGVEFALKISVQQNSQEPRSCWAPLLMLATPTCCPLNVSFIHSLLSFLTVRRVLASTIPSIEKRTACAYIDCPQQLTRTTPRGWTTKAPDQLNYINLMDPIHIDKFDYIDYAQRFVYAHLDYIRGLPTKAADRLDSQNFRF